MLKNTLLVFLVDTLRKLALTLSSFTAEYYAMTNECWGVFHLPKDSGKFPKPRWEMLIGERLVPFDTLVPFILGSLHRPMNFPPKYKMVAQLLLLNEC